MTSATKKSFLIFASLVSLVMFIIGYYIAPTHDYLGYFKHWDLVLSGGDPWARIHGANAYGPAHNLFAFIYAINIQGPKLIFIASWLFIGWYTLYKLIEKSNMQRFEIGLLFFIWFLNPLFLVGMLAYGFNDAFVALLMFWGLILATQAPQKMKQGVSLLAIAFVTKLYPLFLLPFLTREKRTIKNNVLLFLGVVVSVYLAAYLIWGDSVFYPFGKANGRDPAMFSLMAFVFNSYFPFGQVTAEIVILLGNLFILISMGYVFHQLLKGRFAVHTALLLGFTFLFMFYKVGNFQFYISYFAVFLFWVLLEFQSDTPNRKAFYTLILFALWFGVMAGLVYPLTDRMQGEYEWLREVIGLPTFVFQLIIVVFLIKNSTIKAKIEV